MSRQLSRTIALLAFVAAHEAATRELALIAAEAGRIGTEPGVPPVDPER